MANSGSTANAVSVLLGNGNGTFQAPQTFGPGFVSSSVVVLGDLTDDGIQDIVVTNAGHVSVLLGNGNGTFQAQKTFAPGSSAFSLAIGDVNGDGKSPDIVVPIGNAVGVLLGNGNGTFQAQKTFSAASGPGLVALGDVNGDGKLDIVVPLGGVVSVLLGNGNGTFQGPQVFPVSGGPSIALGDLNSDGRLDIVEPGPGGVSVLLNAINGNFTGQIYTIGTAHPFVESINRTTPLGPTTDATNVSFTVTFSEAVTGVDAADFQLVLGGTVAPGPIQVTPVSSAVYTVTVSGMTGNGTLGLNLVDNGTIHDLVGNPLTEQNAPVAFQAQQTFPTGAGSYPTAVASGDVNGDGIPDLVVTEAKPMEALLLMVVGVLLGNGNGTFQPQQTFAHRFSNQCWASSGGGGRCERRRQTRHRRCQSWQ